MKVDGRELRGAIQRDPLNEKDVFFIELSADLSEEKTPPLVVVEELAREELGEEALGTA